jgi:hypothetical protein
VCLRGIVPIVSITLHAVEVIYYYNGWSLQVQHSYQSVIGRLCLSTGFDNALIKENNTIHVSLCLKPLVDGAGPDNDSEDIAEASEYGRHRDAESKQHESKCVAPAYLALYRARANTCSSPFRNIAARIAK